MTLFFFALSAITIAYTYAGYALVVWLLARIRSRHVTKSDISPSVSIVMACHNEAPRIAARLSNLLESDYQGSLEIIVVSDGSTDGTDTIAKAYGSDRVTVLAYRGKRGKAWALNLGVAKATGEIVLFADARQQFEAKSVRQLVRNFADPEVGAVSGELILDKAPGITEGVGLYWRYEKFIRRNEALAGSVIGATGAIYAIRSELWRRLPEATILDDVFTPMQIARGGFRVVFEETARAHDHLSSSPATEFSRKARTLAGNYQLCQLIPGLLIPNTWLAFQFYSHKLLRLAAPLFLLTLLGTNVGLVLEDAVFGPSWLYQLLLALQLVFYISAPAGAYLSRHNRRVRLLSLPYAFSLMNAAAIVGLFYFLTGKSDIWKPAHN
jgi:biofilm PGA synthesis N-glycosyltransferase PgaC